MHSAFAHIWCLPADVIPLYVVATGEGCLIDLELRLNGTLAALRTVELPGGGTVQVSFTHIGGDFKNKQLVTGLLGGSSNQRQPAFLPIGDARLYHLRAYLGAVDATVATVGALATAHRQVLQEMDMLVAQARRKAHAARAVEVQTAQRVFGAGKAVQPEQLQRQLARVARFTDAENGLEWQPLDERVADEVRAEKEKEAWRRAQHERQQSVKRARLENERNLVANGARRSVRLHVWD